MGLAKSIDNLHDLLIEAAETERRLPPVARKQKLASWPDYKHDWLAYADETTQNKLAKATAKQVDLYEKIIFAICQLPSVEDRLLLWATAHSAAFRVRGPAWSRLAKLKHTNRQTIKEYYKQSLCRLYYSIKFAC